MKKTLLIIMALAGLFLSASEAYAYDIVAENIYGVKVYYNYINDGTELEVTSGDAKYSGQVLIPKEVTHHEKTLKVTSIGDNAFWACRYLTSAIIPDGVTSIGENAFKYCESIVSVILPVSLKSIGKGAFYKCKALSYVSMPSSVVSIGDGAFAYCSNLSSIKLPENLTSIGGALLYGCRSLTDIIIPNGVTSIGETAFLGCSGLTTINIPDGVTSIGGGAFESCSNLTSVNLPNSVTSIADNVFQGCSLLTSIVIPEGVTSIANCLFYGCSSLNSVNIPNNVTTIGYYAFRGCRSLTSITIPNPVTGIGGGAFDGCSNLTSIIIPSKVSSIGSWTFSGCSGLTSIISLIENPFAVIGKESEFTTFDVDIFNKVILYVPKGTVDKYKETEGWKDFANIKEIDEDILDYRPLVVEGKEWRYTKESDGQQDGKGYVSLVIRGDTVINGTAYKKLLFEDDGETTYWAAVRENDRKIDFISYGTDAVVHYFDFNLHYGDLIKHNGSTYKLLDEQYVDVSGEQFRVMELWHEMSGGKYVSSDIWIEGIGNLTGLLDVTGNWFPFVFPMGSGMGQFTSCYESGRCIFSVEEFMKQRVASIKGITTRGSDGHTFDLQGRKLSNSKWSNGQIRKGIYVKDGQKFVVK